MISFIKFSTFCFNYTVQDIHVIIIQSESINLFNLHLSLIILPPQVLDYFPINNYQFYAKWPTFAAILSLPWDRPLYSIPLKENKKKSLTLPQLTDSDDWLADWLAEWVNNIYPLTHTHTHTSLDDMTLLKDLDDDDVTTMSRFLSLSLFYPENNSLKCEWKWVWVSWWTSFDIHQMRFGIFNWVILLHTAIKFFFYYFFLFFFSTFCNPISEQFWKKLLKNINKLNVFYQKKL